MHRKRLRCLVKEKPPQSKVVVRLKTTQWLDKRGNIHQKRSLITLKRQSVRHNFLLEHFRDTGTTNLTNLAECSDGVYEIVSCDYDFKLVTYEGGNNDSN